MVAAPRVTTGSEKQPQNIQRGHIKNIAEKSRDKIIRINFSQTQVMPHNWKRLGFYIYYRGANKQMYTLEISNFCE